MIEYVFHFSTPAHNLVPSTREVIETVNKFMEGFDPYGLKLTTPMVEAFTATVGPFHEPPPPDKLAELSAIMAARAATLDGIPFTLTKTTTRTITCKPIPGSSPACPPATPPISGATSPSSGNPPSPPPSDSSSASSPSAG